jgi:hypothetical protein
VSNTQARHRKPQHPPATPARPSVRALRSRHRKPSVLQGKSAKATAVTALAVSAAASTAATQWPFGHPHTPVASTMTVSSATPGAIGRSQPAGAGPAGQETSSLGVQEPAALYHPGIGLNHPQRPRPKGKHHRPVAAASPSSSPPSSSPSPAASSPPPAAGNPQPVYSNPLRAVEGLVPERVDMGVDFGGSGPVYALGDAVITNATGSSSGWPGGGWITYKLTDGPDAGLIVYVAEDVQPTVAVGEVVTPSTVIGNMYNGGDGIETGWAMPDSASAESELPEAGGIGGGGPFPTMVGLSFENLLLGLGVPASSDAGSSGYGTLPPGYPAA